MTHLSTTPRKLERLSLLRANIGDYRSTDAVAPLSMAILAARTPPGVAVQLWDDKVEVIPPDDTPDLAAITIETFTARRAYEIAAGYRARGVPVVMGGYHATFMTDEVAKHCDAVVVGDAEGSWEQLLADFRAGQMRPVYTGGNERPLDDCVLDRSIFAGKKYLPVFPVQYTRGCRFACDFCSIRAFYKDGVRRRAVDRVAQELADVGPRQLVFFVDDNLFQSAESLNELLDAIAPLNIRWSCQISIDVARDDTLLDRMAQTGCVFALLGFESLNEANLRQMGKRWNKVSGTYADVVRRFHARGIAVYGTFVFGYDGDTPATIAASVAFAKEARLEIANFNPLTPTPASPLYDRLMAEGRMLSPQWWLDPNYRYGDPIFQPKGMSPQELAERCFEAKKQFYSWSSIANRVLGTDAGLNWFRTGIVTLANVVSRREIFKKQYRYLGA